MKIRSITVITILFTGVGLLKGEGANLSYTCEGKPLQQVILDLVKQGGSPINSIVDCTSQPLVTLRLKDAPIKEALNELSAQLPDYEVIYKEGVPVLLSKKIVGKTSFPLNSNLCEYHIKMQPVAAKNKPTVFRLWFADPSLEKLNVGINPLFLDRQPKRFASSQTFVFNNKSILDILCQISAEERQSWFCSRVPDSFAKANGGWNQDKPGYCVLWNAVGSFVYSNEPPSTGENTRAYEQYWARHAAIKRARESGTSPVSLQISTEQPDEKGAPILWKFRLKNQGKTAIRFANPWRNTEGAFFAAWRYIDQNGQHGEYQLELKASDLAKEPTEISLAPGEELEKNLNIRGATMTLDTTRTDPQFKGKEKDVVGSGKYMVLVGMYYKDGSGKEYYVDVPEAIRFEVKDKATTGNH